MPKSTFVEIPPPEQAHMLATLQRAARDLLLAEEWFALDEEA